MQEIVNQVNNSIVYDVVQKTSLDKVDALSSLLGNNIFFKREDKQKLYSFKLRGAYQKIGSLSAIQKKKGVITASAGNHAQGVAYSAKILKIKSIVVMPINTPSIKVSAVKKLGAEIILKGESYHQSYEYALTLAQKKSMVYIPPYDDESVIVGQATIAKELLEELPIIDYVFVPVGGGGLISGISLYLSKVSPNTKIIGVEPESSPALFMSLQQQQRVKLTDVGLFAEGVAVSQVGKIPFEISKKTIDEVVLVSDDELCASVKEVFEETRSIVETSGALSVAGCKKYIQNNYLKDKNCIAILSGANVNFDKLRYIAERAELGELKEVIFAVEIEEKIGSFYNFCKSLGNRSITEFNYRFGVDNKAFVFVGIAIKNGLAEKQEIMMELKNKNYIFEDLSNNEMAKSHIRYMVGGKANVKNELIYRFTFPEKKGALLNFLQKISAHWNISLFHYRNYGASFGEVLVGIEVENSDNLEKTLKELKYPFVNESNNKAYQFFL
ncbi:Threonine dehydratase biosynthetic [hydrothermal vent metagenome]|uniref:threonine ammonia-lyase n=1 Tax=hydrothermal vent metagenome TaxID=652676 RepID=A0A1W1CNM5_9ZZZZ